MREMHSMVKIQMTSRSTHPRVTDVLVRSDNDVGGTKLTCDLIACMKHPKHANCHMFCVPV
jgi:streptomycin 6-kinase